MPKPVIAPPPAPVATAQKQKTATRPAASASVPVLVASLASVSEHWPEGIRGEIQQLGLANATCEFPVEEIGPSLRTGRVQCRWKQIRAWIQPPISNHTPSNHAETTVELPLKILAPLYVEHCRGTRSAKKASLGQNIPDVFSKGTKRAAPAPAPVEPPAPSEPASSATTVPPVQAAASTPLPADPPAESDGEEAVAEDTAAAPAPGPAPTATPSPNFLSLPLSLVSETWPDQVRRDVDCFELSDAKLEVPVELIEEGLKQGRLSFRWKQVCHWIRPAPSPAMSSANLETQMDYRVDLPLNFVAPLYLQQRSANGPKKLAPVEGIPDVFNPLGLTTEPAEEPVSEESANEEPAPAVCAAPQAPPASRKLAAPVAAAKTSRKGGEELAELFGEPGKRNWTPNDIVHKTATLPGVAGALIALQDGLLVASCMPHAWKTETISAFLPQIFGRMRQYTNEFKMGDLQSVAFTVEHGTLQVFNAGIIYFAALSQHDAALPIAELTLIAKEIGRHTK
jgi:predicted regulator of Ras-like GTPase activity (Roadblock/LC7/MglB family)